MFAVFLFGLYVLGVQVSAKPANLQYRYGGRNHGDSTGRNLNTHVPGSHPNHAHVPGSHPNHAHVPGTHANTPDQHHGSNVDAHDQDVAGRYPDTHDEFVPGNYAAAPGSHANTNGASFDGHEEVSGPAKTDETLFNVDLGNEADESSYTKIEDDSDNLLRVGLNRRILFPGAAPTVTSILTKDVFTTLTNVFYNTVPVTLTQFIKSTLTRPVLSEVSTKPNDIVMVSTVPAQRTDTITVTDTKTAFNCATEISTEFFTVTHSAYDISHQVVTSTTIETKVYRPVVVSTRIDTEYETQIEKETVTNTVFVDPPRATLGPALHLSPPGHGSGLPVHHPVYPSNFGQLYY